MRADAGSGVASVFKENTAKDTIIPADNADSWVVGSDRTALDAADANKNARAFFSKVKAAFRAGLTSGDQWDDVNVGNQSFAAGINTIASGLRSFAVGDGARATGPVSFAAGSGTASADKAFAVGSATNASGGYAHAEGSATLASAQAAHAEGQSTIASSTNAHAEGRETTASGSESHAEGYLSTASGSASHAEGWSTQATSQDAHAEGYFTEARALGSHAGGMYSLATRWGQKARAAWRFAATGDAQTSQMVVQRQTTDAVATLLHASNAAAAVLTGETTNVLTLTASRAHRVVIDAVARRTDVQGEMAGFSWEGLVGRDATGNARIIGTPVTKAWSDTGANAWTLSVGINTTDATNNYLEILATGETGKTIRWVAEVRTVEVAG